MAEIRVQSSSARRLGRDIEHEAGPWVEKLARLGFAAKGAVYITIGALAIRAAAGSGGDTTGTEGAMQSIVDQPMGRVLAGFLALGLAGYALWRLVQAIRDPEGKGSDAKGAGVRAAYGVSGILHAGLAIEAVRLAMGSRGGDESESEVDGRAAWLMEQPFGVWLVGLVGVTIVGFGLYQLYRAWKADIVKHLRLGEVPAGTRAWVVRSGRLGYAARGIVFGTIGYFLIQAARHYDPAEARGLGGALETLRGESYGSLLLGVVAAGLLCYGVFALVNARYRRIEAART